MKCSRAMTNFKKYINISDSYQKKQSLCWPHMAWDLVFENQMLSKKIDKISAKMQSTAYKWAILDDFMFAI